MGLGFSPLPYHLRSTWGLHPPCHRVETLIVTSSIFVNVDRKPLVENSSRRQQRRSVLTLLHMPPARQWSCQKSIRANLRIPAVTNCNLQKAPHAFNNCSHESQLRLHNSQKLRIRKTCGP